MQTPTFMIQKLPIIQQLMNYIVLQPSYLVYLSSCIKQDFERDILIKIVKQVTLVTFYKNNLMKYL
jgi:hypothetical protein